LLYVLGAWCALGGASLISRGFRAPLWGYLGVAYLIFAFVLNMAGRFPAFGDTLPTWLHDAFLAGDRANLPPYRILHFIVLALFVTRLIPKNWRGLTSPIFKPLIVCGEQSLSVFCVGVFLSFAAHLALVTGSGSLAQQVMVSLGGITIMILAANYVSWSKRQDSFKDQPRDARPVAHLDGRPSLKAG
jgi:hypothetical protein